MLGRKKKALLQSLWSVEAMPEDGRPIGFGILIFDVRRFFGDFFESGRVLGGDHRCYFLGQYQIEDYRLTGKLQVVHYGAEPLSFLGGGRTLDLRFFADLDRDRDRDVFFLEVAPQERAIEIVKLRLTRRVNLG